MRHTKGKTKSWYPFWTDKWLWGSTRHELIVEDEDGKLFDLRGIYVDLLTLSKKDDGFIRANETTPYPHEQLAGMFCVPLDRLKQCIEICLHPEVEKLREPLPGIYYIPSTADYELSERYIRQISTEKDNSAGKEEQCAEKAESIIEYNRKEKNIKEDIYIHWIQKLIQERLLQVSKLKTQPTLKDCLDLEGSFPAEKIREILWKMENYKKLNTNYVSVYLTALNWLQRDGVPRKRVELESCGFCGEMVSSLKTHSDICNKNPKNKPLSITD
jgi:hypothetical protein